MIIITPIGELLADLGFGPTVASHRQTTSSRTGGQVHRGTVRVRAESDMEWEPLCVCGQRSDSSAHAGPGSHTFTLRGAP